MFEILVTVDKHQRFKYFINQTTSIRLEHSSSNVENSFGNAVYDRLQDKPA